MSDGWLIFFVVASFGIPALHALGLLLFGRSVGTPMSGYLGVLSAVATLVCSLTAMVGWLGGGVSWGFGEGPIVVGLPWLDLPPVQIGLLLQVDSLGCAYALTVCLVAAVVSVFTAADVRRDLRSHRQVSACGFLVSGALLCVFAGSLLVMVSAIGLLFAASWLGASHDAGNRVVARRAAGIALAGAMAVALLVIASSLAVTHLGRTSLRALLWQSDAMPPGVFAVMLVLGAAVLIGLFPFQPWLIRLTFAPAGPRVLSALLPPLSGMFVLLRLHPLLTPDARTLLEILAVLTLALQLPSLWVQRELPRVFLLAVGASFALSALLLSEGRWQLAARLVPAATIALAGVGVGFGAVAQVTRGQHALERLGGLIVKLPITGAALALSMLLASGMHFGGLNAALQAGGALDDVAFPWIVWAPAAVMAMLAFGLLRVWLLSFLGPTRHLRTHARAGEVPLFWGSCVAAAVFAVLCGFEWFPLRFLVEEVPGEASRLVSGESGKVPVTSRPSSRASGMAASDGVWPARWGWLVGAALAGLLWWQGSRMVRARTPGRAIAWTTTVLRDGFFFDDFYRALVGGVGVMLADALARLDNRFSRTWLGLTGEVPTRLSSLIARADDAWLTLQSSASVARAWSWATVLAVIVGAIATVWILVR